MLLRSKNLQFKGQPCRKLLPKFVGPFPVVACVGALSYRLQLPAPWNIHPVFHTSLLKPWHQSDRYQPPPPPLQVDGALEYEVEAVVAHRALKQFAVHGKAGKLCPVQYLVKWLGSPPENNTWQSKADLRNSPAALTHYWAHLGLTRP